MRSCDKKASSLREIKESEKTKNILKGKNDFLGVLPLKQNGFVRQCKRLSKNTRIVKGFLSGDCILW